MRGMPFNLTGKGALEAIAAQILVGEEHDEGGNFWTCTSHKRKKGEVLEPRSVLYHRRSSSPPISTSTLSSSLSGGGSTDTGGVATVSEKPAQKWPISNSTASFAPDEAGERKEEWATEFQSITGLPEMGGLTVSGEKCGIGIEDWETMLSASAASPSHEQTFLRWIMSDIEDSSAPKHNHQQPFSQPSPVEFDASVTGQGFGLVDPIYGFENLGGIAGAASATATWPSAIGTASLPSSGVLYHCSRNNRFAEPSQPFSPPLSLLPGGKNSSFTSRQTATTSPPPSLTPGMFFQEPTEEKPHILAPNLFLQTRSSPNPAFFLPLPSFNAPTELHHNPSLLPPHPKRHHSMPTYSACQNPATDAGQLQLSRYNLQQRMMKPRLSVTGEEASMALQQQQGLVDQLFKVAELVEAGNFISAHGILARLNHQLPSPVGKPLLRSAFHFKEALQFLIANSSNLPPSPSHHHRTPFNTPLVTPLDVVQKLSAYKAFSEVSPLLHFTNFTVTQALLEELSNANLIHIIDFDIGIGGQWSSFMQEFAQQRRSSPVRLLKITAFVSLGTYHPLELHLTRENLSHFAAELNIPFEINISNIESFDPAEIISTSAGSNEAIAVNLPVGTGLNPSFLTMLRLVKQLMPKIVVSVDQGCDRSDLPFSHHFLHALESSMILLDSIDASGSNLDMVNKIEKFVLQPRIENSIIGRHRAADKMQQWRTLFVSTGFVPVQFSNFTEMQADCLLKRVQVRGFHVEKRQASLHLHWQRGELVSVSAWSC